MYYSYKNENEPEVSFIYSVFHELICSLHVLANPSHHTPRLSWSAKILGQMSHEMKGKLAFYNRASNVYLDLIAFISNPSDWNESLGDTFVRLRNMELEKFYYGFFFESYDEESIKLALINPSLVPKLSKEACEILRKPEQEREAFVDFISEYYYHFFAKDISFAEPLYIRKLEHQYQATCKTDIYSYINSLHPRIKMTADQINFLKYKLFEVEKSSLNRILIFETSFIMPHLLVGFFPDFLTLSFPIHISSYDENQLPEDTLDIFKGLADGTRMQIIKLLYKGPKSTQLLAEELGISEAGISKQLKVLYKAKIVTKERDGNFVNYHLNIKVLDSLVYLLYEVIT